MIFSREQDIPGVRVISRVFGMFAVVCFVLPLRAQQATGTPPSPVIQTAASAPGGWHSNDAVQLIGLPEIKAKQKGLLSISPVALTFVSPEGSDSVERASITSIAVGDVRVETGGTAGKITRAIIPFGGGSAVATVTHKQFSLLTIEFHDKRDALHGAVFLLPKEEALKAQQEFGDQASFALPERPPQRCAAGTGASPDTIKVAAIRTLGVPVPAEYRVLLYEELVRRLQEEGTFASVYRAGDDNPAAACTQYTVVLTLDGFKKGNAAVRASTGPVGFFVGATVLKVHVQVQDGTGTVLIDKELQASQRGDTDSLNIGDKVAKGLTKDLKKANKRAAGS